MMTSSRVHAQTDLEYNATILAFTDDEGNLKDGDYYITTTVTGGTKYFVTANGRLTSNPDDAGLFNVQLRTGEGDYKTGVKCFRIWRDDNGAFTNPGLSNNTANLNQDYYAQNKSDRSGWERQVLFLNLESFKFAIRSCATAHGTSSWNDAGRTFWTYNVGETATPCFSYTPAYVWSLETVDGVSVTDGIGNSFYYGLTYNMINNVLDKYSDQIDDAVWGDGGTSMNMGEGFGQHSDWDTWYKLCALAMQVDSLWNGDGEDFAGWALYGEDEGYDPSQDPNAITMDGIQAISAQLDSMYQVILDSEVPYTVADGYYRIFAAERYKSTYDESGLVDKAIAASFSKDHLNKSVYGTVKYDMANYVWKLTKSESGDSILLQNVGMETYISFSSPKEGRMYMTEDAADATHLVFDYTGKETVQNGVFGEQERDIFAMRLPTEARGGSYFHQNNHGTPVEDAASSIGYEDGDGVFHGYRQTDSGVDQELTFWIRTNGRTTDKWTSEWYLEPVDEEEVAALVEAFEPIKNHDLLVEKNAALRAEVLAAMNDAKDLKKITSANQLSSPNSDESEGKNIGNLIDGDAGTFWHTSWHGSNQYPRMLANEDGTYSQYNSYDESVGDVGYHYLQISGMKEMVGDVELYFRQRNGATYDHPSKIALLGADETSEDTNWEVVDSLEIPNVGDGAENRVSFHVEPPFKYIRVIALQVKQNNGADMDHRRYWHAAEIQFYNLEPAPTSQFVMLGDIALALDTAYNVNLAIADEDLTLEDYQALENAYKAFMAAMVDPTELRNALATYVNATASVEEGTNPGYWSDMEAVNAYEELYAAAKAYDKAGRYNAAQSHKYAVMLKAMQKSFMEKANGVETDKWYRIMFPTEEMFDAYEFGKEGGDNCESLTPEEQHTMWGTFVTPASLESEEETSYDDDGNEVTKTTQWLEAIGGEDLRYGDRLFFMHDEEIEDKDATMFRFVEQASDDEPDYKSVFSDFKENMLMAIDMMDISYTRGEALITNVSQLSSNASDVSEGQHLEYLIDNNPNTFWHSDWHTNVLAPPYLQVALDEPVSGLIQVDVTRRQGSDFGSVVRMFIQGSNDAENWTNVGYLELPFTKVNESISSMPVDLDGSYKHLRFINTRRLALDYEFDPFAVVPSKDKYNVADPEGYTYFHSAEFQIYPVTAAAQLTDEEQALLDTYKTINKTVLKDATAADVATAVDAYRAYRTAFNAAEQMEVLPYGKDKADPVYVLQNKATGLFVSVSGTGNQNNVYLNTIPTLYTYKAIGYQRSLIGGKDLRGTSTNYMHAGESNCRFCTWSTTEPTTNSGLVLVAEVDEPYEALPEEVTFYRDIKPGKINGWTSAATIVPEIQDEGGLYTCLGRFYVEDEGSYLAMKSIQTVPAGAPVIYILGDTLAYDSESDEVEPMKFTMASEPEFVAKADTINGFMGLLYNQTLKARDIYFTGNHAACAVNLADFDKTSYHIGAGGVILDLDLCPTYVPNSNPNPVPGATEDDGYDFAIFLDEAAETADGVEKTIEKVSQRGNVYSMDGKLLRTGATLNSLKSLGKGMYILNGVKVLVK